MNTDDGCYGIVNQVRDAINKVEVDYVKNFQNSDGPYRDVENMYDEMLKRKNGAYEGYVLGTWLVDL